MLYYAFAMIHIYEYESAEMWQTNFCHRCGIPVVFCVSWGLLVTLLYFQLQGGLKKLYYRIFPVDSDDKNPKKHKLAALQELKYLTMFLSF